MKTFSFGEDDYEHRIGDKECDEGWCNGYTFPMPCQCGGLIHANFGDEDSDCNYWLYKACDKCGLDYEAVEDY